MTALPHPDDTIAALASAPGAAARGIIRISGPQASAVLRSWFQRELPGSGSAWHACGELPVAGLRRPLPVDCYLWPGRRSYTGEPLAELHVVGSPPILEVLLAELWSRGLRPAQPGEFTLRAFLAGRIDLVQAEGVLGVIDARDPRELHSALEQLGGGVSSQVVRLRGDLLDLLADLEAGLDFAEEDIEFVSQAQTLGRIGLAREIVDRLVRQAHSRWQSHALPRVVLAGPPNAGKSTLFNALLGADAAITSPERGTTRDYLAVEFAEGPLAYTLVDTAGSDAASNGPAAAAQQQRREQVTRADLVLWCSPVTEPCPPDEAASIGEPLIVETKGDLVGEPAESSGPAGGADSCRSSAALRISARDRTGLEALKAAIVSRLAGPASVEPGLLGTTAARCRDSLACASQALVRALGVARAGGDHELIAIELRDALQELGKIVGAVYTDELLDRIFSKFCIGK